MPSDKGRSRPMQRRPWKVAHRGWHRNHVENTMEAFRAAYAAGCDMVEFDVQLSRDGVPVIFHDDDALRLAGKRNRIFDFNVVELQSLSLKNPSGLPTDRESYRIPTLKEFLDEFGDRAFYLELKVPEAKAKDDRYVHWLGEESARMVKAAGPDERTFLGSFHGGMLTRLARHNSFPSLAGIFETYRRFQSVRSGSDSATHSAVRYYSVSWEIFVRYLEEIESGAHLVVGENQNIDNILIWNIAGKEQFKLAESKGVAGLVTDDVETLLGI